MAVGDIGSDQEAERAGLPLGLTFSVRPHPLRLHSLKNTMQAGHQALETEACGEHSRAKSLQEYTHNEILLGHIKQKPKY